MKARRRLVIPLSVVASVALISGAIDLPISLYRTFVIEARFGFNRITVPLFIADLGKQLALAALLGVPLAFCVLWLMALMGDAWWLYAWATWIGFNVLVVAMAAPTPARSRRPCKLCARWRKSHRPASTWRPWTA